MFGFTKQTIRTSVCSWLIGIVILCLHSPVFAQDDSGSIRPVALTEFLITPNVQSQLHWAVDKTQSALECRVVDYDQQVVQSTVLHSDDRGMVTLSVNLPRGFYEVRFPENGQAFGLISIAEATASQAEDTFWCVDTAMSWLEPDGAKRKAAVANLARQKIAMVRERLTWSAIEPKPDQWDWHAGSRYEKLRNEFAQAGIHVTEMFHSAPSWTGAPARNAFPTDLAATAHSWVTIARRWGNTLGQLELWNEPDTNVFSGNMPPDQLASFYAAVDYAFYSNDIKIPLTMGGLTNSVLDPNSNYLKILKHCGIVEHIDALAFHNHGEAQTILRDIYAYRRLLKNLGMQTMPILNSECGRAWANHIPGSDEKLPRPVWAQGSYVAQETVMKAIDSRAAGVAQFYAFVYPYYQENKGNWGFVDRMGTPTQALGGYFFARELLSGMNFVGELKQTDPALAATRVFEGNGNKIAVLFTGKIGQDRVLPAHLKLGIPHTQVLGIDGRLITSKTPGVISIPDGIAYLILPDDVNLSQWVNTQTPLVESYKTDPGTIPHANSGIAPSPIIIQRLLIKDRDTCSVDQGLVIDASTASQMPLTMRLWNLGDSDNLTDLDVHWMDQPHESLAKQSVTIKANSYVDMSMTLDLSRRIAIDKPVYLQVTARDGNTAISPIAFSVHMQASSEQLLDAYTLRKELPISDLRRWNSNATKNSKMEKFATAQGGWGFDITFSSGGAWAYPMFGTHGISLKNVQGVYIKGRAMRPAALRVIVYHKDGVGFITPRTIFPADGKWHEAIIRFEDLKHMQITKNLGPDTFDLDRVVGICVGMNSLFLPDNRMEVEKMILVGQSDPSAN
jgi:hypothetical protein